MKNLKIGILVCGALGLVSLLMEFQMFKVLLTHPFAEGGFGLLVIGGFAVAAVMGVMAMTKPPLQAWQAGVALAGFAAVAYKFRLWESLRHIGDAPTSAKILVIADIVGIIVSAIALAKKEAQV